MSSGVESWPELKKREVAERLLLRAAAFLAAERTAAE